MAITSNPQQGDGFRRTAWIDGSTLPTIPGEYECATGGGHVFRRAFDGTTWLSSVDHKSTTVRMLWRGVEPGSVDVKKYPVGVQPQLIAPTLYDGALAA